MTRRQQYEICRQRGHEPSQTVLACYPPLQVCKHCGTHYRYEQTLIEANVPPEDSGPRRDEADAGPDSLKSGDPL